MAYFRCSTGSASSGDGVALVVTCDQNFAGSVITATNGTDTFTETCPSVSPYTVRFEGIPVGTYTISGIAQGQTFSTQYTVLDYSTGLHSTPTGATVTPVNDIQTWLHCANIWDKTYTTLDEVLADASTLQALIASNNAADYMARSTDWASDSNVGLVPIMTSNTTPSGVASASSRYSGTYEPWKAFNGTLIDNTDCWHSVASGVVNSYLRYQATSAFKCYKVALQNRRGANNADIFAVNTFKIQGSNDGETWVDLTDVLTNANKGTAELSEYVVNSNTAYLYHQIFILTSWNSQGTAVTNEYVAIGELQFYPKPGIPTNQNAMTYIGANNYCANKLLSDITWLNAICNSAYSESVLNVKVPTMTSNTAPYGEASASSASSGYEAYKAFDNNPSTYVQAPSRVETAYLQYKFVNPANVRAFDWGATSSPTQDFSLQVSYSDDGTNFTNAGEAQIYASSVNGQVARFGITDYGSHLYWRVARTCITDARSTIAFTLQFYGRT